jgi:hypothetical protein
MKAQVQAQVKSKHGLVGVKTGNKKVFLKIL